MKRIVMLSLVVALLGALVLSTVAFAGYGPGDGSGPIGGGQFGPGAGNGRQYGPGDGTGPIGGGGFGPGECVDLDGNGVCDCQE
jgi:hypothetical protein